MTLHKGREIMNSRKRILLGCIFILGCFIVSACKSKIDDNKASLDSPKSSNNASAVIQLVNKPSSTTPVQTDKPIAKVEKSGDHAIAASNAKQQTTPIKPIETTIPAYSPKQPKVMGLAINELQQNVVSKYGEPNESYVMDDPTEPITVYQYEGFSVGFNSANKIQFVDVSSDKVNAGLNGLQLGQTTNQALEILGKPDTNSSYVLSYNTTTAILKLDIDPKTKTIQSIKLFGVNPTP
jgi:hypothetical protein